MANTQRQPISRRAFQGIAAGIGLLSESISAHKANKQSQEDKLSPANTERGVHSEEVSIYELSSQDNEGTEHQARMLEEQWALDEVQEELRHERGVEWETSPPKYTEPELINETSLAHQFANSHLPPPYTANENLPQPRLSAPVVLPQRRPKNRDRGFIRAYAPALADCGIDQNVFMDFLNTAEKACQAQPRLRAINLASIGTMWLPSVTGIAVSIAIQIATEMAIAAEGRRKTSSFFDQANRDFFQPRGLYCLVMTWNPELADAPSTTVDLNSLISRATGGGSTDMLGRLQHKYKSSDGKGYGNIFPQVAPLVFPEIEQLVSDPNAEKKLSKMKKKGQFVTNYMDKRAQAKFIAENPDSHLVQGPAPTFTSRYADPNHPASSGDPLALVTGGKLSMEKLQTFKSERSRLGRNCPNEHQYAFASNPAPHAPHGRSLGLRDVIAQARDFRSPRSSSRDELYFAGRNFSARGTQLDQRHDRGLLTPIAKIMKKDVLYLAIVNMPLEEMDRANEAVRQMTR